MTWARSAKSGDCGNFSKYLGRGSITAKRADSQALSWDAGFEK